MTSTPEGKTALIAVDVQRDFYEPDGALPVPSGADVIAPLVARAGEADVVVASKDWHPAGHISFTERGGAWPPHCVQGTRGAQIAEDLERVADIVVESGADPDEEEYSAFGGRPVGAERPLAEELRERGVTKLLVGGLATDYGVRATVLDGLREGFEVTALVDAMRAVDVHPEDGERAIADMVSAGARLSREPTSAS